MRQLKISKQITNRENQSLEKYLQEIGKINLISAEEEVELTKRIREGDQIALEKLTNANLRFVVSVAKQYQNSGLSLNDLINEGNVGLIKAAKKFDETRGFKFISYAVWWIRQSIILALGTKTRIVHIPSNQIGISNKINRTFADLEQKLQRSPSNDEVGEVLELREEEIVNAMKSSGRHISMDAPFVQGEENGLFDVLENSFEKAPDSKLMNDSLCQEVNQSLRMLNKKESEIISLYYGLNGMQAMSLEEMGVKFSLTRERVRQIKEKGLNKLRNTSKIKVLKNYLG
jgi:RNA polymerase primary sigma factor